MESLVTDLKNQVQCSLCKETLTDPKLADCFHTFCKMCIKTNTQLDQEENNEFKCPQCDSQTLLQDLNDVEDLQDSQIHGKILQVLKFIEGEKNCSVVASHSKAQWQCIECNQSMCKECLTYHSKFTKNHRVILLSELSREHVDMILTKSESACQTHKDQYVELYCKDCDVLICPHCYRDHPYIHKIISLENLGGVVKDALLKNLDQIEKMNSDEKEKKQQEQTALDIKVSGEQAKEKVKELTNALVKSLRDNEQQIVNDIDKKVAKANRNLRIIRHPTQAQDYIKHFMENGSTSEIIKARQAEWNRSLTYEPFEGQISGIEFKPNEALSDHVKTGLGLLRSTYKCSDLEMSTMRVEPSDLQASRKANLVVELKTSRGESIAEPMENVSVQLTPKDNVKVQAVQMTDDGVMTVDFVPRVCGELTVSVQVQGNDISNSPLVIAVKPQEIKQAEEDLELHNALNTGSKDFRGIAANRSNSKIAVGDWQQHCVRVYSRKGDLLLTYGSPGTGDNKLYYPDGLAFLNETDLVIADSHNDRICILNTATGKLVSTFGCHGDGNDQFNQPCGVHVDDDEHIMVCDYVNNRVQVFTKDGDHLYQFHVTSPTNVVKYNGKFYISDHDNSVIHVVVEMKDDKSAIPVTTIGGKDYTDGRIQWPFGLAIDIDRNLLVCDYIKCLVNKFTIDGRYVGRSSTQLTKNPRHIVVLNDGQLICTTPKGVVFLA